MNVQTKLNEAIRLSDTPFAKGGEGVLYDVILPANLSHLCAKIYHADKRDKEKEDKINYLLNHDPNDSYEKDALVWVKELLYDGGQLIGFLMPKIKGISLEVFCSSQIPKRFQSDWGHLSLSNPAAFTKRMEIATRLCLAIHQLHESQQYLLIDIKPENILINEDLDVYLVDLDSVEVLKEGKTVFDAPVSTPEYTPPEHYWDLDNDPTETVYWDLFGLGVILYKICCGIHPFTGTCRIPNDRFVTISEKIKQQLLPMGAMKKEFDIIPAPHQRFDQLPIEIKGLFNQCFLKGGENPQERPTAIEWIDVLWKYTYHPTLIERLLPRFHYMPMPPVFVPELETCSKGIYMSKINGFEQIELLLAPLPNLRKKFGRRMFKYNLSENLFLLIIICLFILILVFVEDRYIPDLMNFLIVIIIAHTVLHMMFESPLRRLNLKVTLNKLDEKANELKRNLKRHTDFMDVIPKRKDMLHDANDQIKRFNSNVKTAQQEMDAYAFRQIESKMRSYGMSIKSRNVQSLHINIADMFFRRISDLLQRAGVKYADVTTLMEHYFDNQNDRSDPSYIYDFDAVYIQLLNGDYRNQMEETLRNRREMIQFIEQFNRHEQMMFKKAVDENKKDLISIIAEIDKIKLEIKKPIATSSNKILQKHLTRWINERIRVNQEIEDLDEQIDAALKSRNK